MEQKNTQNVKKRLPAFQTIKLASEGNIAAIHAMLKHYEGYIMALSTRCTCDEFGQVHYCVDETLRKRLETKLITKTLRFKPIPYNGREQA